MNDFTKEELESIYYHLENEPRELSIKIKYMIDNYCEHENIVTSAYPRSNPPKKCDACGVLHYDDKGD